MDNVKAYLRQIAHNRETVRMLKQRKKDLTMGMTAISGIDYSRDRITSTPKNAMEEAAWRLLERAEIIDREILRLVDQTDQIIAEIAGIQNATYKTILFKRYVECKDLKDMAKEMDYSYDHICHLHGEALDHFRKSATNRSNSQFLNY